MELCRARLRRALFATSFFALVAARPLPFKAALARGLTTAFLVVLTTFLIVCLRSVLPMCASRGFLVLLSHALRAGSRDLRARI
jgi:hypothetical protein